MTQLPQIDGDGPCLVKASTLRALVQALRERTPIPASGQDLELRSFGFVLGGGGRGQAAADHPFKVTVGGGTGGGVVARIAPGTVNGEMATLAGSRLDADPAPELTLFSGATGYLYLEITFSLAFLDGYLVQAVFDEVRVVGDSAPMPTGGSAGVWRLHLATINNFKVAAQSITSSLWAHCCDAGPGMAAINLNQA